MTPCGLGNSRTAGCGLSTDGALVQATIHAAEHEVPIESATGTARRWKAPAQKSRRISDTRHITQQTSARFFRHCSYIGELRLLGPTSNLAGFWERIEEKPKPFACAAVPTSHEIYLSWKTVLFPPTPRIPAQALTTFRDGTTQGNGELRHRRAQGFSLYNIANDETLMWTIHLANIACGFHASDFSIMNKTATLAKQHGVLFGAQPSLPDHPGLGAAKWPWSLCVPLSILPCFGAIYEQTARPHPLAYAVVATAQARRSQLQMVRSSSRIHWFGGTACEDAGMIHPWTHGPVPKDGIHTRIATLLEAHKLTTNVEEFFQLGDNLTEVSICRHSDTPPISTMHKLLVANRGEIALHIIRTAKAEGILTFALYNSSDALSPCVALADEALFLAPLPSSTEAITWLGPTPSVLKTMELKHLVPEVAMEARVICMPGSTGLVLDKVVVLEVAAQIGYPVMLKASTAGRGIGNGDGICEGEGALRDVFAGVTNHAAVLFNHSGLLYTIVWGINLGVGAVPWPFLR
ncbi:hypothetical protein B0H13DRAFT_2322469 [Mycena leptocephala]|nr:hypothetical protein B0H13DRAFT_2322469 [Mycena leptocephala]